MKCLCPIDRWLGGIFIVEQFCPVHRLLYALFRKQAVFS